MRAAVIFMLVWLAGFLNPAQAAPQVVASIKPVHSLVASVTRGVSEPRLLIPAGASPHTYSLRPSDVAALHDAGLVVWIGGNAETLLAPTIASLADTPVLELGRIEDMALLPARRGGAWEKRGHAHDHDGDHGQGPEHAEQAMDTHLWLDPDNARAILEAVAERLAALDPGNAERYRANAAAAGERLDALEARLEQRLAPVRERPFIVFHDAYHYFEAHFGLNGVGSIMVSPDQPPGARRMLEMREAIRERGAVCVFREPQFRPGLVDTLVEGTDARVGTLDPLGADLPAGPDAYFRLLDRLGDALADCLLGENHQNG